MVRQGVIYGVYIAAGCISIISAPPNFAPGQSLHHITVLGRPVLVAEPALDYDFFEKNCI